jgi:hypothetical protein
VIVNLRDGKTLYTEDFYWDQDKAIIYSNVHVLQISEDGSRLSGDGFKANEDMTDWQVVRPRGAILLD